MVARWLLVLFIPASFCPVLSYSVSICLYALIVVVVTLAKLKVESSACIEFTVRFTVQVLDFANEKVEIVKAWGIGGN